MFPALPTDDLRRMAEELATIKSLLVQILDVQREVLALALIPVEDAG